MHCQSLFRLVLIVPAFSGAVLPCLAGETTNSPPAATPLISKGPYIQAVSPDTFVVMWESLTNLTGTVRYGAGKRLDQAATASLPRKMVGVSRPNTNSTNSSRSTGGRRPGGTNSVSRTNIFYIYEATLPKLKPGKIYAYKVEFAGEQTPAHQLRTLDPGARTAQFIAYGDSRSFPDAHAKLASHFRQHKPDFVLHTGDLVARGKDYALWSREFFKPMAHVIDELPFFSVIGNHEEDGTNYLAYFHLPGKELWYSFDDGPVHFLALDYHFESTTNEQFRFAQQDLMNSRAPWKIVFLHYPVFNIGGHAAGFGHTNYLPMFHAANVDMVIGGHSHLYERFRPVLPPPGQTVPGTPPSVGSPALRLSQPAVGSSAFRLSSGGTGSVITCITTGGGGAELHTSFAHPALVARETTNHYMFFEVTRDTLKAQTMRADGTLIDRFELKKKRGQLPAEYIAQAYPEDALKLVAPVTASVQTRATQIPDTNSATEITIGMKRPKGLPQPVTVQLTLAPESAPYYALENGPLTVTSPSQGKTNTVIAQVRSTGNQKSLPIATATFPRPSSSAPTSKTATPRPWPIPLARSSPALARNPPKGPPPPPRIDPLPHSAFGDPRSTIFHPRVSHDSRAHYFVFLRLCPFALKVPFPSAHSASSC